MVKTIAGKNLKGMTFSRELGDKTLVIGPNGAGKTVMGICCQLAINGYVSGDKPVKTNPDIHSNFASEDTMQVNISNGDGYSLTRQWNKTKKGTVTQTFMVGGKKAKKDAFVAGLVAMGTPKMFDVSEFMQMSAQKKTEFIFDLFPPAGDVSKISEDLENKTEELNAKRRKLAEKRNFVSECASKRSLLELPAGTLAEVSGEIKTLKKQLSEARGSLKKALDEEREKEIAEAKARAKEEAKREAEEEAKKRTEMEQPPGEWDKDQGGMRVTRETGVNIISKPFLDESGPISESTYAKLPSGEDAKLFSELRILKSLRSILDAMQKTGCETCAAGIVVKREILNFKGGSND